MTDPNEAAKRAVTERYRSLAAEYHSNTQLRDNHIEQIKLIDQRQQYLMTQVQDCYAAARLFNFDVVAAMAAISAQEAAQSPGAAPAIPMEQPPQPPPPAHERPTIKAFVMKAAESAYPEPVRARDLRTQYMEQFKTELHEKTVGMTLYRQLGKGLLRRKGFDWYFVPENERTAQEEGAEA